MHVIPKNAVCVQINFPKIGPRGVNGYHPTWLGDDLPQWRVELPAFWMDRHPVTNAQ